MASSSVSQESLDTEDFEFNARKNRVRILTMTRARGGTVNYNRTADDSLGDCMSQAQKSNLNTTFNTEDNSVNIDQGSPTRSSCARGKEKRILRPTYLHPKKSAKDKRKLREKRRSTGVAYLQGPSTESTGDSLDDEEEIETRRNTQHNEVIDDDNPQTPEEVRSSGAYNRNVNNKSPSDLEADFEDNQDYDSTVSHSETNLTFIGQSSICSNNGSRLKNEKDDTIRQSVLPSKTLISDMNNVHINSPFPSQEVKGNRSRDYADSASNVNPINSSHFLGATKEDFLLNRNLDLEKQIQIEKLLSRKLQENMKLMEQKLESRDNRIAQLEKEINSLRNKVPGGH